MVKNIFFKVGLCLHAYFFPLEKRYSLKIVSSCA